MTKNYLSHVLSVSIASFFLLACSDRNAKQIYIAQYSDDKKAAISFTFDDNCESSFTDVVPLLTKYGFAGTFFIIPGQINSNEQWAKWSNLSERGFEIGNHSLTHQNLSKVTDTSILRKEINGAYDIIKSKIGKAPFSFAHPFHVTNDTVNQIVAEHHYATRAHPVDFCHWWGVTSSSTEAMFKSDLEKAVETNEWYVVAAHGVGDCWEPITSQFLDHCLSTTKENQEDLWVDTFQNIATYKIESERTKILVDKSENSLTITLRSSVDKAIFNLPLTVVIRGGEYRNAKLTPLNGTSITSIDYKDDKILLKVLPNGKIKLDKK